MIRRLSCLDNEDKLLLSGSLNQFGSALTFLSVMLLLKEEHGASSIPFYFLIQSLPGLLLLPRFTSWIRNHWRKPVYAAVMSAMGINVLLLNVGFNLFHVYAYVILSSILLALSIPIGNSLISDWVTRERIGLLQTRAHSMRLIMWAIAPPLGGFLFPRIGPRLLFLADAMTFFVAAWLSLLLTPVAKDATSLGEGVGGSPLARHETRCAATHPQRAGVLWAWYALGAASNVLNGVEFGIFAARRLSESEIGVAVGCWGMGGFFSLFGAHRKLSKRLSTEALVAIMVCVTVAFNFAPSFPILCVMMTLMGVGFTMMSGRLRQQVEHAFAGPRASLSIWTRIQQRSSVLALLIYGGLGFVFQRGGRADLAGLALPVALLVLLGIQANARCCLRSRYRPA